MLYVLYYMLYVTCYVLYPISCILQYILYFIHYISYIYIHIINYYYILFLLSCIKYCYSCHYFSRFSLSRKSCYVETLRPGAKDAFRYTSNNLDVPVVIVTSEISPWPLDVQSVRMIDAKFWDFGLSQWVRV